MSFTFKNLDSDSSYLDGVLTIYKLNHKTLTVTEHVLLSTHKPISKISGLLRQDYMGCDKVRNNQSTERFAGYKNQDLNEKQTRWLTIY